MILAVFGDRQLRDQVIARKYSNRLGSLLSCCRSLVHQSLGVTPMSELKESLDLSSLLESGELDQVAFSLHQVALLFRHIEIDILTPCEITSL
jgi:hypothetical protein